MSPRFSKTVALMQISLVVTSLLLPPAEAKPGKPTLALIKVNQFYVLYTCPITPRLDKSGTFIVGAEAIAAILGAQFTQNPQGTAITMTKAGHSVRFTAGAKTALVNGKPVALPAAAQVNSLTRQMLVPLSVLVKSFHIRSAWNQKRHLLSLQGTTLIKFNPIDVMNNIYPEYPGPDTHSLVPVALTPVAPLPPPKIGFLNLTVQNVSRRTIPRYCNYVNLLVASKTFSPQRSLIGYTVVGAAAQGETTIPNLPLKPGATRQSSTGISFPPFTAYTVYVAAWPVVSRRR